RKFWSMPGTFKIKVMEPISMEGVKEEDLKDLMNQTRDRMLVELKRISPPRINLD
ncbi:hypothetical protein GGI00_006530, partial [Coemansia sp. RSA 2681]